MGPAKECNCSLFAPGIFRLYKHVYIFRGSHKRTVWKGNFNGYWIFPYFLCQHRNTPGVTVIFCYNSPPSPPASDKQFVFSVGCLANGKGYNKNALQANMQGDALKAVA